jgi:hypothetical protein
MRGIRRLAIAALPVLALTIGLLATSAGIKEPAVADAAPVLFADGFESGSTSAWTTASGLVVQTGLVDAGSYAARATMTGAAAMASKTLAATATELTASVRVLPLALDSVNAVNFVKLRTATGTALAEAYLAPSGVLGVRNDVSGVAVPSSARPALGAWHTVTVHALISGTSGTLEVGLDGAAVPGLSMTTNLGITPIGRVQAGENVAGRTADLVYDSVAVTGPIAPSDPVLMAAGDIACDPLSGAFNGGSGTSNACKQRAISDLVLADPAVSAVAALGDVQYYCGGAAAFNASYGPSWGRFKSLTRPAVGNHEYLTDVGPTVTDCDTTGTASGYFGYFGASAGSQGQGYYGYDLGAWHVIVLNSNCSNVGGCSTGSPQDTWLQADLAAHPSACTLAYWHIPLWSSGGRAARNSALFVQRLYAAGADVVLSGHDHIYERFAPQDPSGVADPARGLRAFVVGTGGANHTTIPSMAANSVVANADTFGLLRLTLHPSGYDWTFVPEPGATFTDSGSSACH